MEEITTDITNQAVALDDGQKKSIAKAIELYDSGDYSSSLSLLLSASNSSPDAALYSCIGNCYKKLGQTSQAKQFWEKALNLPVTTASPYINLGTLYYEEGNINKAIIYWIIATTISPDNSSALYNLASAYNKKDLRMQSLAYYEKFIKYNKDISSEIYKSTMSTINKLRKLASVNNHIGICHYNSKSYSHALEAYLSSVKNYPLQPQISNTLGSLFFSMKNYESAVKHWLEAFVTSDFNVDMYDKLPYAYEFLNMPSYAYCFYYQILHDASRYNANLKNLKVKLFQLTPVVYKDIDYSKIHYFSAKQYEEDNNYHYALIEYKNALILAKANNKQAIQAEVSKMHSFIHPDEHLAESLVKSIDNEIDNINIEKALSISERAMLLAKHNSETQRMAIRKRNECQNLLKKSEN